MMSSLAEHKRIWRTGTLLLLLIALAGPWFFDKIHVPQEYECAGAVRLEGDFCGIGISGVKAAAMVVGMIAYTAAQAISEGGLLQRARELMIELAVVLIILPLFSLMYLQLKGHRRHVAILSLGCAATMAVVAISLVSQRSPHFFWDLWGPWLYFGTLLGSLVLELFSRQSEKAALPVD